MAASAAATVRMKKTNTCPARSPLKREKGNEIHVHGKQHQFDAHQQQNDILAIDENARHAEHEQHAAEHQVMRQGNHSIPSKSRLMALVLIPSLARHLKNP